MPDLTEGVRIAFDVGKVRVGVAVSDKYGILASPLLTLQRQDENLAENLLEVLNRHEPVEVFVGLPTNLNGIHTESTRDALEFAHQLKELGSFPVFLVDERLSTVSAQSSLRAAGYNSKTSKSIIDQQAACVILESALNSMKLGKPAGLDIGNYEK